MGLVCPASDISLLRPLPEDRNLPSASRRQAPDSFRPRGFPPPRRFTPQFSSGDIAPQYRTGSAAFHTHNAFQRPDTKMPGSKKPPYALPATLTPLEEVPSSAAVPRHRGRCPHALTILPTQIVRQHHAEPTSDPASCRFDPLPAPSQSMNQTPPPKRWRYTRLESKEVN
jgi:hypothetical protein